MPLPTVLRLAPVVVALAFVAPCPTPASCASPFDTTSPDGRHDFDFNIGTWHSHIRRVLDPFDGGHRTAEMHGTVTVEAIWDGRAQVEQLEADGPSGHMAGVTLFLYDPAARQWSQSFFTSAGGPLTPSLIGGFSDGQGELVGPDIIEGRAVLVRAVWSAIKPDSHHLEESFSDDGGRTWRPAFIADLKRVKA